jgi:hypothetical protein
MDEVWRNWTSFLVASPVKAHCRTNMASCSTPFSHRKLFFLAFRASSYFRGRVLAFKVAKLVQSLPHQCAYSSSRAMLLNYSCHPARQGKHSQAEDADFPAVLVVICFIDELYLYIISRSPSLNIINNMMCIKHQYKKNHSVGVESK